MTDYYGILGVRPSAGEAEIKSAFKRLAKTHHPDRNPQNPKAEESFKAINEAYQILSDPGKRLAYDYLLTRHLYAPPPPPPSTRGWPKSAHPHMEDTSYLPIDPSYVKGIVGALAFVFLISVIVGLFFNRYKGEELLQAEKDRIKIELKMNEARKHFERNHLELALITLINLQIEFPHHEAIARERSTMLEDLRKRAIHNMETENFRVAIGYLRLVVKHTREADLEAWELMGDCFREINQKNEAEKAYDYVARRDMVNPLIHKKLGSLYMEMDQPDLALSYYQKGIKAHLGILLAKNAPGTLALDKEDTSPILLEMYAEGGGIAQNLGKWTEGKEFYDWLCQLDPQNARWKIELGICYLKLGESQVACNLWASVTPAKHVTAMDLIKKHCQ
jgi:tetratricopeptide (TPR) repeat protein